MGVPASHPPLGSLPANLSFQEGGEPVVVGLLSAPPLRQHVPRSRRANARRGDHERHRRPTQHPHVLTCVKAASLPLRPPRRGASAWTPAPRPLRNRQLSDDAGPRPCHTPTAPARVRFAATAERHSSFVSRRRVSFPAGPQERSARSVAAVTEGRSEAEDLRSRLTAATDRALPDAGDRPALISLSTERPGEGRIDGGSEPARRRARISVRGSWGRSPPPAQCRTLGMLAPDIYRSGASCSRAPFPSFVSWSFRIG